MHAYQNRLKIHYLSNLKRPGKKQYHLYEGHGWFEAVAVDMAVWDSAAFRALKRVIVFQIWVRHIWFVNSYIAVSALSFLYYVWLGLQSFH
jgi:hypothetical protein